MVHVGWLASSCQPSRSEVNLCERAQNAYVLRDWDALFSAPPGRHVQMFKKAVCAPQSVPSREAPPLPSGGGNLCLGLVGEQDLVHVDDHALFWTATLHDNNECAVRASGSTWARAVGCRPTSCGGLQSNRKHWIPTGAVAAGRASRAVHPRVWNVVVSPRALCLQSRLTAGGWGSEHGTPKPVAGAMAAREQSGRPCLCGQHAQPAGKPLSRVVAVCACWVRRGGCGVSVTVG